MVAGGLESVSLVQGPPGGNKNRLVNPWVQQHVPGIYHSMIQTADTVAARYKISRGLRQPDSVLTKNKSPGFRNSVAEYSCKHRIVELRCTWKHWHGQLPASSRIAGVFGKNEHADG